MMMIFVTGLVCLVATIVGAISGIGGGVIIKPVMDAVSGLPVSQISFLSGCTVLAMSVVSLLRSKGGPAKVEPRRGTLLAVGGAIGGVAGKAVFDAALHMLPSGGLVGGVQNAIMILLTVGVLAYMSLRGRIKTLSVQNGVLCLLIGFGLGMISAFLGIGGGPINLVVLYFFFSMDTKTAALNSLYVILFSQITSLASTLIRGAPPVDPAVLAVMVLCGVAGGFIGRALSVKMSVRQVDRLFSVLLVVIICISCYNLTLAFL